MLVVTPLLVVTWEMVGSPPAGMTIDYPRPVVPASGLPAPTVQPELLGHQFPLGLQESLQPAVCPHVLHVTSPDDKGRDVHRV